MQLADRARHLVLPVITLAYAQLAIFARFSKSALTEVIRQDFITTARAKGATDGGRAVAPRASATRCIPLITLLGLTIPYLISGSVIVEQIFQWDGIGRLYFDAILDARLSDGPRPHRRHGRGHAPRQPARRLLYAVADPRIRLEAK